MAPGGTPGTFPLPMALAIDQPIQCRFVSLNRAIWRCAVFRRSGTVDDVDSVRKKFDQTSLIFLAFSQSFFGHPQPVSLRSQPYEEDDGAAQREKKDDNTGYEVALALPGV